MNQSNNQVHIQHVPEEVDNSYIQILLCLEEALKRICGNNYPREIVELIIMIYYKPIKIRCGWTSMSAYVFNKVYNWNNLSVPKQMCWNHVFDHKNSLLSDVSAKINMCESFGSSGSDITHLKRCMFLEIVLLKNRDLYEIGYRDLQTFHKNRIHLKLMLVDVMKFDCGLDHTIALVKSGKIYVWGTNTCGQLGLGDFESRDLPCELVLPLLTHTKIMSFSCGAEHTILITDNAQIYVWGDNGYGQLGLAVRAERYNAINLPQKIQLCISVPSLIKAHCGPSYSVITTYNKIYVCGNKMGCANPNIFTEI